MSICVTENSDSRHMLDKAVQHSNQRDLEEQSTAEDFKSACQKGDANAMCQWAHMTTDWEKMPPPAVDDDGILSLPTTRPQRLQTLAEVMAESLDYGDGPSMSEAMQLILNAANGMDVQAQAKGLIDRMAGTWARFNTEES